MPAINAYVASRGLEHATYSSDWRVWALSLLFVSLAVGGGFLLAWATDNKH